MELNKVPKPTHPLDLFKKTLLEFISNLLLTIIILLFLTKFLSLLINLTELVLTLTMNVLWRLVLVLTVPYGLLVAMLQELTILLLNGIPLLRDGTQSVVKLVLPSLLTMKSQ
jgi:hypothetical protein